jgi:NHL repeat-containing protein
VLAVAALATGVATAVLLRFPGGCYAAVPAPRAPRLQATAVVTPQGIPCGVTFAAGYVYYTLVSPDVLAIDPSFAPSLVRRVSLRTGKLAAIAGSPDASQTGTGRPALNTAIGRSCAVAVDRGGNVLVADGALDRYQQGSAGGNRILVVAARTGTFYGHRMRAGYVYALAGRWNAGYDGDGGAAGRALLNFPSGLAVDNAGNIAVADSGNGVIRVIAGRSGTFYDVPMTAGDIYTIAGRHPYSGLNPGYGNGVRATAANLSIVAGSGSGLLRLGHTGIAFDHNGNVVIADSGSGEVRVVAVRSGVFYGRSMRAGYIYTVVGGGADQPPPDGDFAVHARFPGVGPVAVDNAGDLLLGTGQGIEVAAARSGRCYGHRLRAGHIYQVTGYEGSTRSGVPAISSAGTPIGLAVDSAGNVVFADYSHAGGHGYVFALRVIAASSGRFYGLRMTAGDVYTIPGATAWP